ncbi:hypothetical protein ABGB12_10380 [Actinocorallia sp. B10E7]|uniref:hypothetical protein n=1 Tax=Actinocorallia sp. B10E7 TaxID=3153558 RepID=UPI00325E7A5F
MEALILQASVALVSAMATDAWQQVRAAMTELWHRAHPDRPEAAEKSLDHLHEDVLDARQSGDSEAEQDLVLSWQAWLERLLREDPSLAKELKRILDEELVPALRAAEPARVTSTTMRAKSSDQSRIFQAGRDQHITGQ